MCYLRYILFVVVLTVCVSCSSRGGLEYKTVDGFAQGTTFHIVYEYSQKDSLNDLIDSLLVVMDNSISIYNEKSIVSKINRNEDCELDSVFIEIFKRSEEMYRVSDGFFDVSSAPIFEVWGFGSKEKGAVSDKIIDSLRAFVGMDKVRVEDGVVIKSDPRVKLNFNAIAQGYTSDLIASFLDRRGVLNYMVEVGGEVVCKGLNPNGIEWLIGIDKPIEGNFTPGEQLQAILKIKDRGLATSGNYRKFIEGEDGERYSHTIDPKSGYPVKSSLLSATVIAKDAATADAYGTYFMVIGLERAKEELRSHPEIDGYLIYSEGGKFQIYSTNGVLLD